MTPDPTPQATRLTISDAPFLVTFAAGGLWQTIPCATEQDARRLAKSRYMTRPDWPRAPRIWRAENPDE